MRMLLLAILSVISLSLVIDQPPASSYDPLSSVNSSAAPVDFNVSDVPRQREIPIRVFLPEDSPAAPVVLFSHGLGGSREGSSYLGKHWSARAYVVVYLQHPGSDDSVWREKRPIERRGALAAAANLTNVRLRAEDVRVVLDQLEQWNQQAGHPLQRRLDMQRIGMSGHSFGAVTTQIVSGQRNPIGPSYTDPRIKAAVLMSPHTPRWAGDPQRIFGDVRIPWMLLTGTLDNVQLLGLTAQTRLEVYNALPAGDKFQLVLHNAQHSAFNDRRIPGDLMPRNPSHHRAILAVTTAFWDAYLRADPTARQWLQGDAVKSILDESDDWQTK